jgi:hypothetical protein
VCFEYINRIITDTRSFFSFHKCFGPGRFAVSYLIAGASGNLLSAMKRCVTLVYAFVQYIVCCHIYTSSFRTLT